MNSSLELLTGSKSLSFSSVSSYLQCSEKYALEKIARVPQTRAWYLLGGSAVHEATERIDREEASSAQEAWDASWQKQLATLENDEEVRAGGRASRQWPDREDRAWWAHHGPQMVQSWIDWRKESRWTLLFVEHPFEVEIGGVWVRGYIDRGFVDGNGQGCVVDLKTGSHTPASALQLSIYRLAVLAEGGASLDLGGYWMARKGGSPDLHLLTRFSEDLVGRWLRNVQIGIESGLFTPHMTSLCSSCTVSAYCEAAGGTRPALYDTVMPSPHSSAQK